MIPAIRWSPSIRWSPAIRWSPGIWWSIRSMDFDNRKVYGDTSITDGLVIFILWDSSIEIVWLLLCQFQKPHVVTLLMFELKTRCFDKLNNGNIFLVSETNIRKASGDWGKWPIDYVQTEGNQILCIRAPASEKDEQITQLSSHSHLQQTL